MQNPKTIIYLNYSPYENSGHILDYLSENFKRVYLFSIAHHPLGRKNPTNMLATYVDGRLQKQEYFTYLKAPYALSVLLVPLRSFINAFQIIIRIFKIKNEIGNIDYFFSVNAFIITIGRILKRLGLVNKVIFWVWDYYPPEFPTLSGRVLRRLYWQFDKFATYTDKVYYLNHRMADVRKEKGVIPKTTKIIVVPIGMGDLLPVKKKKFKCIRIGFIGVLKKSQGIDMLLESAKILEKHFCKIAFEIVGSGPDENEFKKKIRRSKKVIYNFYGYVTEQKFRKILYNCTIGVSPYSPEEGNISKYTDPGKPKRYIEFNLPVITTDVIEFSNEIVNNKAGIIMKYGNYNEFAEAIKKIINNYDMYVRGALKLHKKYFYKNVFPVMFKE